MFTTLMLVISIYARYLLHLSWLKTRGLLGQYDSIINTGYWQMLVVELVINSIQPLPFLWNLKFEEGVADWEVKLKYRYNDILLMLMCLI